MFAHYSVVLRIWNHPEKNCNIIKTSRVFKLNVYMIPGCPLKILNISMCRASAYKMSHTSQCAVVRETGVSRHKEGPLSAPLYPPLR